MPRAVEEGKKERRKESKVARNAATPWPNVIRQIFIPFPWMLARNKQTRFEDPEGEKALLRRVETRRENQYRSWNAEAVAN